MMTAEARHEAVLHLKQVLREKAPYHHQEGLPSTHLKVTVPTGALTEIQGVLGAGATEATLDFLCEHSQKSAVWLEKSQTFFPVSALRKARKILFVEAGDHILWAILENLRSQLFQIMVIGDFVPDEKDLRRIQMAAEKSGTAVLFLNHSSRLAETWPFSLQLRVRRSAHPGALYQILESRQYEVHQQRQKRRLEVVAG